MVPDHFDKNSKEALLLREAHVLEESEDKQTTLHCGKVTQQVDYL